MTTIFPAGCRRQRLALNGYRRKRAWDDPRGSLRRSCPPSGTLLRAAGRDLRRRNNQVPAQAGTHRSIARIADQWIPACAGMTTRGLSIVDPFLLEAGEAVAFAGHLDPAGQQARRRE